MLPMRTIITVSIVSILLIFILAIMPAPDDSFLLEEQLAQGGRVLGVSEGPTDESYKQYRFEDLGYPGQPVTEEIEPTVAQPVKSADAPTPGQFGCPVIVVDKRTQAVLYSEESDKVVPIASITKLMTALVALDVINDLDQVHLMTSGEMVAGGQFYLKPGDEVRASDLFHLSLIASDNSAAEALMNSTGFAKTEFIARMNERARQLGMANTSFVDAVGLSQQNQSTAREIAILMDEVAKNEYLKNIINQTSYSFETLGKRAVSVRTTNNLLMKYPKAEIDLKGGKTGHTNAAGYCLASDFSIDENDVITVVLGAKESYQRFTFTEKIAKWISDSYTWE